MKKDISNYQDIVFLVDNFYKKVRKDPLLSHIFNSVIGQNWDAHLDKMYRFWQTVLFKENRYSGKPFLPHTKLPIHKQHFDQWLLLFKQTINENFNGPKADEIIVRANKMAIMFQAKLSLINQNNQYPII